MINLVHITRKTMTMKERDFSELLFGLPLRDFRSTRLFFFKRFS